MNAFVLCQCTVGGGRGGGGGRSARKLSDGNSLGRARGSDGFDLPCPVLWRRRRKHFEGCREGASAYCLTVSASAVPAGGARSTSVMLRVCLRLGAVTDLTYRALFYGDGGGTILRVVAKGVVSAYSLAVSAPAAPAGGARTTSVMLRV